MYCPPWAPAKMLDAGVKGVVLESYGSGNISLHGRSFLPFLEIAAKKNLPVVMATQCVYGGVELGLYAGGQAALDAGAISAGDMTAEASLAKLSVLLGRGADLAAVRAGFNEDWAGERS